MSGKEQSLRINHRIRVREVRLVDDEGKQVGVVPTREALQMAETRGLDLVEVAPNAVPPVCRLMDYGKFRYEQSKKERESRKNQKQIEMKEIRLKPKTDEHDLDIKIRQARKFLLSGDKVKFTVRFRGREMAHMEIGREQLDILTANLQDIALIEQKPEVESRSLSVVLSPNQKALRAAARSQRTSTAPRGDKPEGETENAETESGEAGQTPVTVEPSSEQAPSTEAAS